MTGYRHFSRLELCRSRKAIELGIDNEAGHEFNTALAITMSGCERVRAFLGFPMQIHSGFRCPKLNAVVGGEADSQHLKGEAVDFSCPVYGSHEEVAKELALHIEILGIDQLILEPGWVHMSFTLDPRFEVLRKEPGGYSVWSPIGRSSD